MGYKACNDGFLSSSWAKNTEELSRRLVKKALLEDQLETIIQKMIVAKAPSCFIMAYGRNCFGQF